MARKLTLWILTAAMAAYGWTTLCPEALHADPPTGASMAPQATATTMPAATTEPATGPITVRLEGGTMGWPFPKGHKELRFTVEMNLGLIWEPQSLVPEPGWQVGWPSPLIKSGDPLLLAKQFRFSRIVELALKEQADPTMGGHVVIGIAGVQSATGRDPNLKIVWVTASTKEQAQKISTDVLNLANNWWERHRREYITSLISKASQEMEDLQKKAAPLEKDEAALRVRIAGLDSLNDSVKTQLQTQLLQAEIDVTDAKARAEVAQSILNDVTDRIKKANTRETPPDLLARQGQMEQLLATIQIDLTGCKVKSERIKDMLAADKKLKEHREAYQAHDPSWPLGQYQWQIQTLKRSIELYEMMLDQPQPPIQWPERLGFRENSESSQPTRRGPMGPMGPMGSGQGR